MVTFLRSQLLFHWPPWASFLTLPIFLLCARAKEVMNIQGHIQSIISKDTLEQWNKANPEFHQKQQHLSSQPKNRWELNLVTYINVNCMIWGREKSCNYICTFKSICLHQLNHLDKANFQCSTVLFQFISLFKQCIVWLTTQICEDWEWI